MKRMMYSACIAAELLVAGCSAGVTTTEQAVEEVGATKLYQDALGREVEIPVTPKRVVALWTVGEMLALNTKPIGSTEHLMRFFTEEEKEDIAIIGDAVNGDYEKSLALAPDLIVLYGLAKPEELEKYQKIAPTVTTAFFGEAMASLRSMGEILNKQQEAEAWVKAYTARVASAREDVASLALAEQKAVVLQLAQKNIYLYRSATFPTIFDAYQLQLSDYQAELQQDESFAKQQLSMESLPNFADVDRIFLIVNDAESKATYEQLQQSGVWKNLPAVQKNQVYVMSERFSMADVSTLDWALDEVKEQLLQ